MNHSQRRPERASAGITPARTNDDLPADDLPAPTPRPASIATDWRLPPAGHAGSESGHVLDTRVRGWQRQVTLNTWFAK
jgi:hypothetical protein